MPTPVTVAPDALEKFIRDLFEAAGVSAEDAATAAPVFVWANLRGVDSHGLSRVPRYVELFGSGEANASPTIAVDETRPGVTVVDADRAPGPVALTRAADIAIEKARQQGIALVAVRGTVHTGAIGYYASRIADAGLVGLGMVAGMPNMGYEGAKGAAVATSPLAIAVPGTGAHPTVLLDMATAVIALGKIAQFKRSGAPLPEGAATTADGTPTTDANEAKIPLPVGGAKGSGLSLMFEMLTSVLVTAPILTGFHGGAEGGRKHRQNATLIAIDPAAVGSPEEFAANVDATVDTIHALTPADGVDQVLVPGERGAATFAKRSESGIPVGEKLWNELVETAGSLGVTVPEVG
ncbi:Ldh family oxidoreductase [Microbacterium sp. LRZ72]|uniref:Ldh family oxidoreductase n=1 Tax=Microbacterium sp. LRZ72 TaxID=2942481 RepID=UPI0029AE4251|nr:Ldh family oxidoreductase [Microbacterium sp. LRZ72]MDX2377534.1 Ldh family oxidoreductase [Microbacterium sp. LRZ72]